jgi:hypothetical protein
MRATALSRQARPPIVCVACAEADNCGENSLVPEQWRAVRGPSDEQKGPVVNVERRGALYLLVPKNGWGGRSRKGTETMSVNVSPLPLPRQTTSRNWL